jgi:hypothetical protein
MQNTCLIQSRLVLKKIIDVFSHSVWGNVVGIVPIRHTLLNDVEHVGIIEAMAMVTEISQLQD